ncbi:sensor histidine kinase [Halorubrum sp. CBA1125]|uniref:sensor histidine kinase n=1 Tax=Halorubrum sp. CBA1125 TaxID=2668072 RepID=UPI002AA2A7B2|nr:sensor histidine kinase [Halorubrum sp. CBA1125]
MLAERRNGRCDAPHRHHARDPGGPRPSPATTREPHPEQRGTRRRRRDGSGRDLADGFFIEDDGPGIPEETRDRVFEAGYTTAGEGTGYGLKIVNEIVVAHRWEITVTDSDEGGARFEITGVALSASESQ